MYRGCLARRGGGFTPWATHTVQHKQPEKKQKTSVSDSETDEGESDGETDEGESDEGTDDEESDGEAEIGNMSRPRS